MSVTLTVEEFAKALGLTVVNAGRGTMEVSGGELNRPGLQFTGYFEHFANERVQLLGNSEIHYLDQMDEDVLKERMDKFMSFDMPAVICARDWTPLPQMQEAAKRYGIPLFQTERATTKVSHATTNYLDRKLAPTITRHGVLLDVYGIGVMLTGESGLGKSESALEIVKRGHRLVADDVVEITKVSDNRLSGTAPELTRHLMEIRGIGIIDVRYMYGVGAVINEKSIDIVMELELWQENKAYDRLGLDEHHIDILGVSVPYIEMPVRPGRNMAIVIEVAARNFRMKRMGYDAAKAFDQRIINMNSGLDASRTEEW